MAVGDPIRKLVQLILDKNAANKMEGAATKSLSVVDKGFARLKKAALQLAGVMAAAFGVRAIIRFGKEAVRVAGEAEAIWSRLGQSVENVGISFAQARPEIEAFAGAMQDATTVGDEEFAEILAELVQISGDYSASLRNVGLVADLAAAKQIDFKIASQLTGRAMIGETALLKRYGIVVEEGADAIEIMREQFRGFAEKEAKTFQGRIGQLTDRLDDLKQAVGDVLIEMAGGTSILEMLNRQVKDLTDWINEDRVAIVEWARVAILGVKAVGGTFTNLLQLAFNAGEVIGDFIRVLAAQSEEEITRMLNGVSRGINKVIEGLNRLPGVAIDSRAFVAPMAQLEANTASAMASMRRNAGEAGGAVDDLVQNWVDLAVAIENVGKGGTVMPIGRGGVTIPPATGEGAGEGGGAAQDELTDAQKEGLQIALRLRTAQEEYNDTVARLRELLEVGAISQQTFARGMLEAGAQINNARAEAAAFGRDLDGAADGADALADALGGVGEAAQMSYAEVIALNAAADLGGGLVAALFGSDLGKLAAQKAEQNAIMAAEQLAMAAAVAFIPGFQGEAAGHVQAAAMFGAVAAAWGALAGATGGFSGGGGGSGSPRDTGGAASERTAPPGDEVHIYFLGPGFSAVNPEVQKVVYGAAQEAAANFGPNTKVKYHRRPRG